MPKLCHRVAFLAGVFLLSCQGPEEQILSKFFDAVRSGDHVTLAGMSVVGFSGPVESWEVVEVGPEAREAYRLPELKQLAAAAEERREQQYDEYSEFRAEHYDQLEEILDRHDRDPDYRFRGKWGEIQEGWEGFRRRYEELTQERQVILREIDQELRLAKMSLMSSEEIENLDGDVITKEVVLNVSTREAGERHYLFVLRKYELASTDGDYKPPSRWIVTAIEEM